MGCSINTDFFPLNVPAERYEAFWALEGQAIAYRHIFRTVLGDPEHTRFRDEIMLVSLDEAL